MNNEIEIFRSTQFIKIQIISYFPNDQNLDLAILKTEHPLTKEDDTIFALNAGGLILGQDVAFLGFPLLGNIPHPCIDINEQFPIPFVKKACASSLQFPFLYLDGHNNPGFSGGPVVFYDASEQLFKICGIVSSYIYTHQNIHFDKQVINNASSIENTGIFVAHHIKPVSDLIENLQ